MKNIVSIVIIILCFFLTGCGNTKTDYEKCDSFSIDDFETIEEAEKFRNDCKTFYDNYNNDW